MTTTTTVTAPVSGTIGEIYVANGATVKAGDVLLVQTSTKVRPHARTTASTAHATRKQTETRVAAPAAGKVTLLVGKGKEVGQGDRLADITS